MQRRTTILGNSGFLGRHVEKLAIENGWQTQGLSLSRGCDLRDAASLQEAVGDFAPSTIINCAAHVGGLSYSRSRQATLLSDNMRMALSLFDFMSRNGGVRLVNPIANCAYPGDLGVFREDDFWRGEIHSSVLGYGGARRFSVLASQAYRDEFGVEVVDVALPNLYGPGDHLDPVRAHALGALVFRILSAQSNGMEEVSIWGSGKPVREWLYVKDAARALISAAAIDAPPSFVNVGTGMGVSIADLARKIAKLVGFEGALVFDESMPDGAPEKRMVADLAEVKLGWTSNYSLEEGLALTVLDVQERLMGNAGMSRG